MNSLSPFPVYFDYSQTPHISEYSYNCIKQVNNIWQCIFQNIYSKPFITGINW
ncbi:unnamed protein product [Paramecium octaurelia]|uniref:Uncharacterized protein n=1 Tax=Paramecium octaurelia TaxID=43137 RepID=A0A8S1YD82_PAROT|nr:unnamed protein product [Paramecium octaurelia]